MPLSIVKPQQLLILTLGLLLLPAGVQANSDCLYRVVIEADSLNIRSSASQSSQSLGRYQKGDRVCVRKQVNNWYATEAGWISAEFVSIQRTKNASNNVSVRPASPSENQVSTKPNDISGGEGLLDNRNTISRSSQTATRNVPPSAVKNSTSVRVPVNRARNANASNGVQWLSTEEACAMLGKREGCFLQVAPAEGGGTWVGDIVSIARAGGEMTGHVQVVVSYRAPGAEIRCGDVLTHAYNNDLVDVASIPPGVRRCP